MAVGVVLYNAGILDCTVEEVVSMDRKTRKILAVNGCLHTRSNVARLYLPRKEGKRGLIGHLVKQTLWDRKNQRIKIK